MSEVHNEIRVVDSVSTADKSDEAIEKDFWKSLGGFRNNWNSDGERPRTGLASYMEERGVEVVFVCGLARDVCAL